jgi:hypothetical protein
MTTNTINAVLVELNISTWTARKLDRTASKEVKESKGAYSDDAARVNKNLLAGMNNLKRVTDFVALKRNEFYQMTLPWSDSGQRLSPMMQFFELKRWVNECEQSFNQLVLEFLRDYPTLISAQAFQLGALFDRNEFPSVDDIKDKFRFKVTFLPLPSTGDFRVDASASVINDMKKEYEEMFQERIQQVNQDLWTRLHDTLQHMSDRLGYDDTGKGKIFRDTMVDNAVELCDMLKRLNVTNNPALEKARAGLESALLGIDASEIRRDGARDEVKSKVDTVLADWF